MEHDIIKQLHCFNFLQVTIYFSQTVELTSFGNELLNKNGNHYAKKKSFLFVC